MGNRMPSWDVRLLTSTYSAEGDGVVVELYGKTREGRSIVVRHHGFRPYFHMLDPPEATRRALEGDPEVVELKDVDLRNGRRTQRFLRVTIRHPWKVPQYRERYRRGTEFYAADIPFGQRFVYDLDLGACVRVIGAESPERDRSRYTVELVVDAEGYEECQPFLPPLKLLSFDIENSIKKETFGQQ